MNTEARQLLELLRPAVARAEQIQAQHQQLLHYQEVSAEDFSTQIAEATRAAAQERDSLLEARNKFAALREAEISHGREEAKAIIAAAR
eukprot:CAMPEP_0113287086 /NCGR_PEP_ID=MMETSP0008_2-20120614/31502_1 /TAXON_ID=97485 /ORGANISM="Prymnesium parvum" /LENGTH=88 /DNA_ID=CAMNT_0000138257 /DNA_START=74 /DNA_END=336 /DNA_ORIENTATION=+ /assembly_acc=CAM_ASM_000153